MWQRKGSYEAAGVAVRRAEGIQQASGPRHPTFARTLNLVAQQFWFEGDLLRSKDASQRAVEVAELTLRPDHPTLALAIRYLAGTLLDLGDLSGGLALAQRALGIAERNFGPDHHVTGEYLHGLGLAELDQGDYATARLHFQRALKVFETRYGPWHEYVATASSVMALADARLGDFARARQEQSRAVAIHERVGGPNHPFVAVALTELATLYREQGASAEALPLLERALAIRERSLGAQHRDVARTLADLASTLSDVGRPTRAQTLAVRAVEIWERQGAPDAPEFATVLALYAKLQTNRGDSAAARAYYERALAIRARTFGVSHPLYAEAQAGLAVALAATGDRGAALEAALAAESTGRDHLRVMLRSLPERQGLTYAATRPRGQDLILSLPGSTAEAIPAALNEVIRSRALVLDEIAARQGAMHAASDREQPARAALATAQQRLANLTVRGPGPLPPAQYAAVLDEARQESERAEQALATLSAAYSQQRRRELVGLAEIAAALPADTALVSLVRYNRLIFTAPAGARLGNRCAASRRSHRPVLPGFRSQDDRASGGCAAWRGGDNRRPGDRVATRHPRRGGRFDCDCRSTSRDRRGHPASRCAAWCGIG